MPSDCPYLLRKGDPRWKELPFSHPWNAKPAIAAVALGRTLGLQRAGISLARIPPGKESFVYHSHRLEEEWLYILSGSGVAEIDDSEFEVTAGDFMAFPTPSVAHQLRNAGADDLIYLMGGENREVEIADFPRLGRRMIRDGSAIDIIEIADVKPFNFK